MIPPICLTKDNCSVYPHTHIYAITSFGADPQIFVALEVVGLKHIDNPPMEETVLGSGNYQRIVNDDDLITVKVTWHLDHKKQGESIDIPIRSIKEKCVTTLQAYDISGSMGYPEAAGAAFYRDEDDPVNDAVN